ncbi:trans-aconitate 2-methyltransferase [Lacunisphaera limnophila]|uniref:Trans-aconitate 2-methyltransferase n=1 Tax=Lacunisphaera limnophila TaxID=1838286 RepID=A0A1D8AXW7_9BACT|nr:class I SAM-dependent methyltransferase [Lacunisphaera limnophila]AOS45736.1 trans-aconitate 2-methyltransferase [Lacunisphaera limnophila]
MPNLLQRAWNFIHYRLIHAPRGGGKPVPATALDEEYRSGHWDHFTGPSEQARHEQLVALIYAHAPGPTLLDLGCGSGRLAAMLDPRRISEHLGVDLSEEGLARARALGLAHARFESGNFETWRPAKPYDVITFNECLGYARHPAVTAAAFGRHLTPGGVLIVSHFRWGNWREIWRSVEKEFTVVATASATNDQGQVWDLKVLRPRPPGA